MPFAVAVVCSATHQRRIDGVFISPAIQPFAVPCCLFACCFPFVLLQSAVSRLTSLLLRSLSSSSNEWMPKKQSHPSILALFCSRQIHVGIICYLLHVPTTFTNQFYFSRKALGKKSKLLLLKKSKKKCQNHAVAALNAQEDGVGNFLCHSAFAYSSLQFSSFGTRQQQTAGVCHQFLAESKCPRC